MAYKPKGDGTMTVAECGRKGGTQTSKRHGKKHYQAIGKMGGAITSAKHGPKFYKKIGKMGGSKVKRLTALGREALKAKEAE